ncbi:MAG: MarR family winged helix-turn-helix transcriptional regulator [Elusimicrobiota bacterium]
MTKKPSGAARPSIPVMDWTLIMRIYSIVIRQAEVELSKRGLTVPRFDILAQLGGLCSCPAQDDLVRKLMVTKGNVSSLIHRMVQDGLVERTQNPDNRRCNNLRLSAKGHALRRSVLPEHEAWIENLFGALGTGEQKRLFSLLKKLFSGLTGRHQTSRRKQ